MAEKQSMTYVTHTPCASTSHITAAASKDTPPTTATLPSSKCFFCGYSRHTRSRCPAQNATCKGCGKKGHFAKVCHSKPNSTKLEYSAAMNPQLSTLVTAASAPSSLSKATINVSINGHTLKALVGVYSTCEGIDFKGRRNLPLAKVKSSKGAETCHLRRYRK